MRRCRRPSLRRAPYSLCLCFSRPPATALISIQEEIFSHSFELDDPHFRVEKFNEDMENILALNRDCLLKSSSLGIKGLLTIKTPPRQCSTAVLWQAFFQKFFNAEIGSSAQ
jgi:hypothetical protein